MQIKWETEALERADEEAKWREVKEALRSVEERERLEVQRLAAERRVGVLKMIEFGRLEAELRKEAWLWQEAELQRPMVNTTEEGGGGPGWAN